MKKGLIIGIVIIFVLVGFFIKGLNRVVTLDENIKEAWSQIENQLQRRNDLIPNLVNTVKGYTVHEKEIFKHVADARAKLAGAISHNKSISEKITAAQNLGGALSRLLMIVENYPDLKANQNFAQLMDELAGTENRIAVERMRYNRTVKIFNAHIRRIPGSFFASLKNLSSASYFKAEEKAAQLPEVKF
ncbi:MAG: LemA family protein [Candidatus Omnitrophica bacterium]|nr:LemA family protein [Candidatus Omnitrophota bacterium]